MREEDFPCLGEPERPITEDLCRNAGARYASVFSTAEDMVKAALEVKRLNRDVWVKLPFCVTIEAEAFGAEVSLNSLSVPALSLALFPVRHKMSRCISQELFLLLIPAQCRQRLQFPCRLC